jgi:nucleotide-binding universal stress UspA family protein
VIVVGIDGSAAAKEALQLALREASMRGTRVRAVHAWTAAVPVTMTGPGFIAPVDREPVRNEASALLHGVVDAVAGEKAGAVECVLAEGPAGQAILENAHDAELIVLGQRGLGTVGAVVLGSVSHHVLHHASCPVLVVPPPQGD